MRYCIFFLIFLIGCGESPKEIAQRDKITQLETRIKALEAACASFLTAEARDATALVQETSKLAKETNNLVLIVKADGERQKAILAQTEYHNRLTNLDTAIRNAAESSSSLHSRMMKMESRWSNLTIDRSTFKKNEAYSCQCDKD